MNIVERFNERFLRRREAAPVVGATDLNRAGRRRLGWRGRSVPVEIRPEAETFVPRYIRRHFQPIMPTTRRQRRARARSIALALKYGLK